MRTVWLTGMLAACGWSTNSEPVVEADTEAPLLKTVDLDDYAARTEPGGYRFFNPAHGFVVRVDDQGMTIQPDLSAREGVTLSLRAVVRGDERIEMQPVPPWGGDCYPSGEVDASGQCLRRVVGAHSGVELWWENRPDGLQLQVSIPDVPNGFEPLMLEFSVSGAEFSADAAGASLYPKDQPPLHLALAGWNYPGTHLQATSDTLTLVVDARSIGRGTDVGLILTNGNWQVDPERLGNTRASVTAEQEAVARHWPAMRESIGQLSARFASSLSTAGDVNGDGFDDLVVGSSVPGRVYLFDGSTRGLSRVPSWVHDGQSTIEKYGHCVASAGDVNNDGFDDVLVGVPRRSIDRTGLGGAELFLGAADGLSTRPAWSAEGDVRSGYFGGAVSSAGDVNGDGFDDVLVGQPGDLMARGVHSRAVLYLGSAEGLGQEFAWQVVEETGARRLGASVAAAGDVNADGFDDVLVGVPGYNGGQLREGAARLYLGSASGLAQEPAWQVESDETEAAMGYAVSSAGDVNGDGFDDVVVGTADSVVNNEGMAQVYLGSASGLSTTPAWQVSGGEPEGRYGYSVGAAGDLNGDGFDDVVIGAPVLSLDSADSGRALVYLGASTGLSVAPAWTLRGDARYAKLGSTVNTAGDVNGDGLDDLAIAADNHPLTSQERGRGRGYVLRGFVDSDGDGVNDAEDCNPSDRTVGLPVWNRTAEGAPLACETSR